MDREKFDKLMRRLCASQECICEAMAFCFDKSGAAKQISDLLRQSLLEDGPGFCVDTRIARLYLLSDVLFNSQQPGVRNAFRYRDAIEAMAPSVFASMGKHGNGEAGRMTMNKLSLAVHGVLNAWTKWSVYNSIFIDELTAKFEGREWKKTTTDESTSSMMEKKEGDLDQQQQQQTSEESATPLEVEDDDVRPPPTKRPRGDWKIADDDCPPADDDDVESSKDLLDCTKATAVQHDNDDEFDGEPFEEEDEFDGEPMSDGDEIQSANGEFLEILPDDEQLET